MTNSPIVWIWLTPGLPPFLPARLATERERITKKKKESRWREPRWVIRDEEKQENFNLFFGVLLLPLSENIRKAFCVRVPDAFSRDIKTFSTPFPWCNNIYKKRLSDGCAEKQGRGKKSILFADLVGGIRKKKCWYTFRRLRPGEKKALCSVWSYVSIENRWKKENK
jgi:hypothetical protein